MEFESPDVEKDFPGLYASESGKKSNESDCTSFSYLSMSLVNSVLHFGMIVNSKNMR
jgi:hypothetical protein